MSAIVVKRHANRRSVPVNCRPGCTGRAVNTSVTSLQGGSYRAPHHNSYKYFWKAIPLPNVREERRIHIITVCALFRTCTYYIITIIIKKIQFHESPWSSKQPNPFLCLKLIIATNIAFNRTHKKNNDFLLAVREYYLMSNVSRYFKYYLAVFCKILMNNTRQESIETSETGNQKGGAKLTVFKTVLRTSQV